MKNPNRYGTITKLSGNRRRPFIVKEGQTGQQKIIGYAATKSEALILLAEYNTNPWDIETDKMTLQQLYELWLKKRAVKLGKANVASLKSSYHYCKKLANTPYRNIKAYEMQDCIDSCNRSYATQANIKNLWVHLDKFAMELDIISKCYSTLLTTPPAPETTRKVFTEQEIALIWQNKDIKNMDTVLFFLYTGFRFSEMLDLKVSDVDLCNDTITGGVKTKAGKNRIVPIHPKIKYIIQNRMEYSQSGYLFENNGKKWKEFAYRTVWVDLMHTLHMNHIPHECRHTFRSRLDSAGANKVCIDRIIGHKSSDVGERVYTHKTIQELKNTIALLN